MKSLAVTILLVLAIKSYQIQFGDLLAENCGFPIFYQSFVCSNDAECQAFLKEIGECFNEAPSIQICINKFSATQNANMKTYLSDLQNCVDTYNKYIITSQLQAGFRQCNWTYKNIQSMNSSNTNSCVMSCYSNATQQVNSSCGASCYSNTVAFGNYIDCLNTLDSSSKNIGQIFSKNCLIPQFYQSFVCQNDDGCKQYLEEIGKCIQSGNYFDTVQDCIDKYYQVENNNFQNYVANLELCVDDYITFIRPQQEGLQSCNATFTQAQFQNSSAINSCVDLCKSASGKQIDPYCATNCLSNTQAYENYIDCINSLSSKTRQFLKKFLSFFQI